MVHLKSHGGACCGARHLHEFGANENRNPNLITEALSCVPLNRATEVILNGTQVTAYPNVLAKLAELGFVLDGHWVNGNHDSDNYRFTRCDNRRSLVLANWDGMVISSTLQGELEPIPGQHRMGRTHVPGAGIGPRDLSRYMRPLPRGAAERATQRLQDCVRSTRSIGQLFVISQGDSAYNGRTFTCISERGNLLFFRNDRGDNFSIRRENCTRVREILPPPEIGDRIQVISWGASNWPSGLCGTIVNAAEDGRSVSIRSDDGRVFNDSCVSFIHIVDFNQQPDFPRIPIPIVNEALVEIPVGNQRHTEVQVDEPFFTTFHCVSRDGTRGAGFDTYEEARRNLGRRTIIHRREFYRRGNVAWFVV